MMSFFNYKKDSKKGYMEREGFFYNEIHKKCGGFIHITLLTSRQKRTSTVFMTSFYYLKLYNAGMVSENHQI